jgi:hypothetical protein
MESRLGQTRFSQTTNDYTGENRCFVTCTFGVYEMGHIERDHTRGRKEDKHKHTHTPFLTPYIEHAPSSASLSLSLVWLDIVHPTLLWFGEAAGRPAATAGVCDNRCGGWGAAAAAAATTNILANPLWRMEDEKEERKWIDGGSIVHMQGTEGHAAVRSFALPAERERAPPSRQSRHQQQRRNNRTVWSSCLLSEPAK